MTRARFRLELPDESWIADLSTEHPGARFRLLTGIEVDDGALELGEIRAEDVEEASQALASHPAVREHEALYRDDERSLARYVVEDTSLYDFVRGSSFPPEFPLEVRDGWMTFGVTGPREHLRRVRSGLEASGLDHEVERVVDPEPPGELLTERQMEAVRAGVRLGYYEVPRDCNLEDVADEMEVDPSTASGLIRRAEARVLDWFLSVERDRRR